MTHRERFHRIYNFEPVDRIPLYYFGAWPETKKRWIEEGFTGPFARGMEAEPQPLGMDPAWEGDVWWAEQLVNIGPMGDEEEVVLEETNDYKVIRDSVGGIKRYSKRGTSIPHTIRYPLEPTRESWNRFRRFLDPSLPGRYPANMEAHAAELNAIDNVTCFVGGALYNYVRDYMGVEELSYLMYDDPILLEDIVAELANHFMTLMKPVLKVANFDFVYFFEDCCGANGPLFSPAIYKEIYDKYYRQMITFYKDNGVPLALIDSDGMVDQLVPCWLGSGFDILFPIERGKWGTSPASLRKQFGDRIGMLGGVDKFVLGKGPEAIRAHLMELKKETDKGGYIPIPDHRIPPEISLNQMMTYIDIFHEVFG